MIAAAIDVGTNSVKAVVGESDGMQVRILADNMLITRLGEGLDASGRLGDEARARTLEGIRTLVRMARDNGARRIRAVATSAMRDAQDGAGFVAAVSTQIGVDLEVLSEEDEGRLSYAAVALDPALGRQSAMAVVDIGGGSTEFAFGSGTAPDYATSVRIGAVRLTERQIHNDPLTDTELASLATVADEALLPAISGRSCDRLVGVGGSIVNAARIHLQVPTDRTPAVHAAHLTRKHVEAVLQRLRGMTVEKRKHIVGLDRERADTIIAGVMILERAVVLLGVDEIRVSTHGLRHGVLYEMLALRR